MDELHQKFQYQQVFLILTSEGVKQVEVLNQRDQVQKVLLVVVLNQLLMSIKQKSINIKRLKTKLKK
jgi:hypothetical protein